ncbi:hypothetical protein [Marinobacterium weihaiense]|uniref:Uncharacterized protein n=1 Tax=Marinobacterium weihaiense TaxID=2851016 RepID=A0ABS6M7W6_9GAMM|nr:hypothetical protein [Marinobacterium weihaiense]MBV0932369.1 hypothetical protein [Marinobacterium weihaiense]
MRKEAAPATEATTRSTQSEHNRKLAAKYKRVLRFMLEHGSITRLQAEKPPVFDHCLPSTVSCELIRRHGLVINSVLVKHSGFGGVMTSYKQYSVAESSMDAAKAIVWGE